MFRITRSSPTVVRLKGFLGTGSATLPSHRGHHARRLYLRGTAITASLARSLTNLAYRFPSAPRSFTTKHAALSRMSVEEGMAEEDNLDRCVIVDTTVDSFTPCYMTVPDAWEMADVFGRRSSESPCAAPSFFP